MFLTLFRIPIGKLSGMDVNCGSHVQYHGASVLQQGKITEQDINRALHNLFAVRMRLGLFNGDPRRNQPGVHAGAPGPRAGGGAGRHRLLKNDGGALPLSKSGVASLAVIGFNADDATTLRGKYFGPPCVTLTPLQVLQGYVKDTRFVASCNSAACNITTIPEAVQASSIGRQLGMCSWAGIQCTAWIALPLFSSQGLV
jgi:beta-glucosidase-like glycosyl hydrolase